MVSTILFFIFAGIAIGSAVSMVYHKNPLYSAISLVGVFISLSCIYVTLAAPFIAAVQILIYAGAIMVLVVFVIMLLNLDDDKPLSRLRYLFALGGGLGLILLVQTFFIFYAVMNFLQERLFFTQRGAQSFVGSLPVCDIEDDGKRSDGFPMRV